MAFYFSEPSHTFDEYLLVPGYTGPDCIPANVSLKTPVVRYNKKAGEKCPLTMNIPMVSAVMQSVSNDTLAVALAKEGGISFIYGSQTIENQAAMIAKVKAYKAGFVTSLYEARFVITKGFILVNKNVVFNYNYLLNTNDIVEVKPFLYNYILKNINFNDLNKFKYLRNLQVDYKTFSFIFLNKFDYFILNYNNFIKKIYYKQNFNNTNSILINNNYNFLINLFKNYISLNRSTKVNLNKINYLLKFIKYKYNDYYFRNILLKQTFKIKYLYLKNLLQYTQNFNFENIDNIFTSLFEINNFEKISNSLNNSFFNYYYNLIFNFYIFTLKYNNFNYKMVDKTMLFLNLIMAENLN